ncbi:MAG: hypothetical protein KatS3mg061_0190 [Dehalococcoidia bacterium]|nr:MAG: hypothetical protein KatS3mg061_0190 [Dehalococcoidia bacterium]
MLSRIPTLRRTGRPHRSVGHGILQQVAHHLTNAATIGPGQRQRWREDQLQLVTGGQGAKPVDCLCHELAQVAGAGFDIQPAGLETGHIEQAVDELAQPVCLF